MPYLAIKKVKKQFNKVEVLKGIDLEIEKGEFICFLGPSGRSEERRVGKECRSRWSPYH